MLKSSLIMTAMLMFAGCGVIDDAINTVVSAGVSKSDISKKEKVLIINGVAVTACATIKIGLIDAGDFKNADTLVTEQGVTCSTYDKTAGSITDKNAECRELPLDVWLEEADHNFIETLGAAEGDKACVIGGDV